MVSVIIPTYCRKHDVVIRAVKSVQAQTYTEWEIYVVDDNKDNNPYSDSIKEALKSTDDKRIHYIRMEKNSGACAARNKGIKESKGEYVAFLDDDDEWMPNKLEKQLNVLGNGKAGFAYCGIFLLNERTGAGKSSPMYFTKGDVYQRLLRDNFIGSTSEVIVKRECFSKCGYFREDMPSSQDYEMWLRLAKEYEVESVPEDLVVFHLHEGDSISKSLDRRIEGYRKILETYYNDIIKDRNTHSFQLYNLGKFLILNHQSEEGISYLLKAIKLAPLKSIYYIAVIGYWKMNYWVKK